MICSLATDGARGSYNPNKDWQPPLQLKHLCGNAVKNSCSEGNAGAIVTRPTEGMQRRRDGRR